MVDCVEEGVVGVPVVEVIVWVVEWTLVVSAKHYHIMTRVFCKTDLVGVVTGSWEFRFLKCVNDFETIGSNSDYKIPSSIGGSVVVMAEPGITKKK